MCEFSEWVLWAFLSHLFNPFAFGYILKEHCFAGSLNSKKRRGFGYSFEKESYWFLLAAARWQKVAHPYYMKKAPKKLPGAIDVNPDIVGMDVAAILPNLHGKLEATCISDDMTVSRTIQTRMSPIVTMFNFMDDMEALEE